MKITSYHCSIREHLVPMILILLLMLTSCAHYAPPVKDTLPEKILAAYGGKDVLAKVHSLSAEGTITRFIMAKDEGIYTRFMRRDGKLLVNITYPNSSEVRILNGSKGYRGTPGHVREVFSGLYLAMVYQYNQLDLPFGFIDGALKPAADFKASDLGDEVTIRCEDRAGNGLEFTMRRSDFRIIKTTGYFQVGSAMTSLNAEFDDFRTVDGILLPFRITNYAGGKKISETIITHYKINPHIDDSTFSVQ